MQKRAFIIHGWGGNPEEGWFPWLKKELEAKGFEVTVPAMPDTDEPEIGKWVPHLARVVGEPDEQTFLVGHSIGCQTILRYLESLPEGQKVGGAVLVAGFLKLILDEEEEEKMARPWLETPIDFEKVKSHASKITAIFSTNDPYVPAENQKMFEENLGAKILVLENKGHVSGSDGVTQLPSALDAILEAAG